MMTIDGKEFNRLMRTAMDSLEGCRPDTVVVHPNLFKTYKMIADEEKRNRELFSPIGLKRLFVGLWNK